jgi:CheY-like chemotaxis protein
MMSNDLWRYTLNEFKEDEQPEAVLMMAGDPELMRIVVAWTRTSVNRARRLSKYSGESEEERWMWLWENARFDREKFLAAGMDDYIAKPVEMEALKDVIERVLGNRKG